MLHTCPFSVPCTPVGAMYAAGPPLRTPTPTAAEAGDEDDGDEVSVRHLHVVAVCTLQLAALLSTGLQQGRGLGGAAGGR